MSNIFYKYYIKHNNLSNKFKKCEKRNNYSYFELIDISKELHISKIPTNGMAKYENRASKSIIYFDYDKFLSSLPALLINGKKRCDAILYTYNDRSYFILNELKDRDNSTPKKKRSIRYDAREQLKQTLQELYSVPEIRNYINSYANKICISSNSQPYSALPAIISSVLTSFNPLAVIAPDGLNLPNSDINSYGFQYWDLIGNQSFKLL